MADGFRVDLAALKDAASGISGTIDQVNRRKVSDIDCDNQAFGHDRLADTVNDFCGRWARGVDNLATDSRTVVGHLTESAKAYEAIDQSVRDHLDKILQGSGHDPAAGH